MGVHYKNLKPVISFVLVFLMLFAMIPYDVFGAANPWDPYAQYLNPLSQPEKREMRATWIVTAYGSDWPKTKVSGPEDTVGIASQKKELTDILDRAVALNLNAVMFQVRPAADAMYKSDLVPWSGYLSGGSCANGGVDPGYDPLQFAIEEAHKRGLELHAWANPYRAATAISDADVNVLKNVDKSVFKEHPEWVKKAADGVYVADPGIPEVQQWVEASIMEIVNKYDVDGIHFDDYFYHETVLNDYDDNATFALYGTGFNDKGDWRRNNVTTLIKELSRQIRSQKPWVKFGISPAGVWGNKADGHPDGSNTTAGAPNYDRAFADTRRWANEGIIDYICPQIYWSFGLAAAPYGELATWWANNITNPNTQLYIGMALYKANANADPYWMEGQGGPEIDRQLKFNSNYPNIDGSFLYQSSNLSGSTYATAVNSIKANWPNKALVPAYTWKNSVPPAMPITNAPIAASGGLQVTWKDNDLYDRTMYYSIYRFGINEEVDLNDATKLLATVGKTVTSYSDTGAIDPAQVKYIVTALDRLHNESMENAPTPVSTHNISVTTARGTMPVLPPSVTVTMSDNSTANMMVKWEAIPQANYTANGSFTVNGQLVYSGLSVSATVTVTERQVAYAYPVKVTTYRGTAPVFPKEVNAIYTDNSPAVLGITWDAVDPASYGEVGMFFANGTVSGSSVKVQAVVTVVPDITSITPVAVSTMATVSPVLPAMVEVIYSDNSKANLPVAWDNIPASSYSKEGSFEVNGTVTGTSLKAVANVTVTAFVLPVSVANVYVVTGINAAPKLPASVTVSYSDNSTASRSVIWEAIDPALYSYTHRFVVNGTVDGVNIPAKATVEVASVILIDNYEDINEGKSMVDWTGASQTSPVGTPPKLSYNTDPDYVKSGDRSLRIDYDFVGTSGTASAYVKPVNALKFEAGRVPKKIGLWIYGDGMVLYQVRIAMSTASTTYGSTVSVGKLDFTGWKYVEAQVPDSFFGPTPKDMYLTFAPGLVSTSTRVKSTIYVDNLVAIYGSDTIDYAEINASISNAQKIYNEAIAGTANGNYPAAAKTALQSAIDTAMSVKTNAASKLTDIYEATDLLKEAVAAFEATKVVSERTEIIDDFEGGKYNWYKDTSSTAQSATVSINTDAAYIKSGTKSLKIDYNMGAAASATSTVKVRAKDNSGVIFDKGKYPGKIGFWMYGDGTGNRNRIQYNFVAGLSGGSPTGSVYNYYDNTAPQFTPMSWTGWRYVELPLPPAMKDPDKYVAITIPMWIQYLTGGGKTGTVYIDDYSAIYDIPYTPAIDKTGLIASIATAKAKLIGAVEGSNGGQYPAGAIASITGAVKTAQEAMDSTLQEEINLAQSDLNKAIQTFVNSQISLIDKPGLKAAIDAAQAKYDGATEGQKPGQYQYGSKTELLGAINLAASVYLNTLATKEEVDMAKVNLAAAVSTFDSKVVPALVLDALNNEIDYAQSLHDMSVEGTIPGQYNNGAKSALLTAINTARGVRTNTEATQGDIDSAVINLKAAVSSFDSQMVPLPVNRTALIAAIDSAKKKVGETSVGTLGGKYPQSAWTTVQTAITAAEKVNSNNRSTQEQLDTATTELNSAVTAYLATRIPAPWDAYTEFIPKETPVEKRHLRATWVSTVINLDWPSKASLEIADPSERMRVQKDELVRILDEAVDINANAVMFQVRPTSDAFYKSQIAPWSYFLTGKLNGDPGFDPLGFAIEEAHKRNLELHAWFNPYRVSMPASFYGMTNLDQVKAMLSAEPKSIYSKHPEWVKIAQNRLVLDPGIPGARAYVEDCIMEVVNNYDIDGVHFDDYFYVGNTGGSDGINDTATFAAYGAGFTDIKDWRRNNTYLLVKELSNKIRTSKTWVKFGISPAGVWANQKDGYPEGSATSAGIPNYTSAYADTRRWVLEEIIDYICPQIYWTFGNSSAGFGVIADWWADLLDANPGIHTQLYIGEGIYWPDPAEGATDPYWLNGEGVHELERQLTYNITRPSINGTVLFRHNELRLPPLQEFKALLKNDLWKTKALVPAMPYKGGVTPAAPVLSSVWAENEGAALSWTDNDPNTSYYAIYRFGDNDAVNINDPRYLLTTMRKTNNAVQNYVDKENKLVAGKYVVTALNRLHDESGMSAAVSVARRPVIEAIMPVNTETVACMAPILPSVVQAVYSDKTIKNVTVTWDPIPPEKYAAAGSFTVQGSVYETDIKAAANILVRPSPVLSVLVNGNVVPDNGTLEDSTILTLKVINNSPNIVTTRISFMDSVIPVNTDSLSMDFDMAGRTGAWTVTLSVYNNGGSELQSTLHFNVITSVNSVKQIIEKYKALGELKGPLAVQATNSLAQAEKFINTNKPEQAAKHLEDLIKHLNNDPLLGNISTRAREVLIKDANYLIKKWLNK